PSKFGWVGLGAMGYPMVIQLRRKMSKSNHLCIFDINRAVLERFVEEMSGEGPISIASSSKEVAEKSV
ncbi:hypothetical protein BDZ94DRAFT_1134899, partial [Collybia nuda]